MEFQPEPTLIEFIRYNNWANAQILAVCQKLTAEQLAASAPGTYGTIHATLAHIIKAETSYIRRLTGSRPEAPFKWEDRPALSDIAAFAPQVAQAMLDAVAALRRSRSCMRKKTVTPTTTRHAPCSFRSSITASNTVPTSPPSSAGWDCRKWKLTAGGISAHTRLSLR